MTNPGAGAWVRWLDGSRQAPAQGVTWGTPWPRGKQREARNFALRGADQILLPLQSWPLAYWPDGSLKWTAHALAPADVSGNGPFEVVAQRTVKDPSSVTVKETGAGFEIDTGTVCLPPAAQPARTSSTAITRGGRETLRDGRLVLLRQDRGASTDSRRIAPGDVRELARESHGRAARPGARRRETRRQTRRWQSRLAAFHIASVFLRGQRRVARPAHHRVRWRRVEGFHPRHRSALLDAAHRRPA